MTDRPDLKTLFGQPGSVLAPGVFDAFSAMMAARAGFDALYLSGAAISYTQIGRPDLGLVAASEVVDVIARIRDRVDLPLIVDADTGFGNALNMQRTVRTFERAGASALQIEDQVLPKRCGHMAGKTLVSLDEMAGKVRAAVDARHSEQTLIIARTDAIAVEGFEAALDRANAYVEAGADVLFVEAPQSIEHMRTIVARFGARLPLLANMVEGGKTPVLSQKELEVLGFKLVITPGALVRAIGYLEEEFFARLKADGSTAAMRPRMFDFAALNERLGLPDLLADGERYDPPAKDAAE
jgi:2-methylisocitrate lyase-like PEP mutase family enzyme